MTFEHATPTYLAALEDKGLFGAGTAGGGRRGSIGAAPTVPAWIRLQPTKYVPHAGPTGTLFISTTYLCNLHQAPLYFQVLLVTHPSPLPSPPSFGATAPDVSKARMDTPDAARDPAHPTVAKYVSTVTLPGLMQCTPSNSSYAC
jgi:hypothetical protein